MKEGEFADMDGWNAEADAETMLNGLGITSEFHDLLLLFRLPFFSSFFINL